MANKEELIKKIDDILDKTIRPAMKNDGGNVKVVDFDDNSGTVFVELEGACVGCPMSQMTLKDGVERILKEHIEEVKSVEQI